MHQTFLELFVLHEAAISNLGVTLKLSSQRAYAAEEKAGMSAPHMSLVERRTRHMYCYLVEQLFDLLSGTRVHVAASLVERPPLCVDWVDEH
ncbi:hypothetical protein MCOR25_005814 [Pyricularia grisea]|nr:hypothetical protein MCOR25_005814 [Pyricularia grisea]